MTYAKNTVCIYAIRRIGTDECYVGQTVCLRNRWRLHKQSLKNGKHTSIRLQRVFNKYGLSVLSLHILETLERSDTLKADLTAAEQKWFDAIRPCYNMAPAAGTNLGIKRSAEAKARLSVAQKKRFEDPEERKRAGAANVGKVSPWKGKTPSEETRQKMRLAKVGVTPFAGKSHTAETKAKISAAKKGKPSPNLGRPRTAEATAKQSASMLALSAKRKAEGIPHHNSLKEVSAETRAKMSAAKKGKPARNKGIPNSPEAIAKQIATIAAKKAANSD